MSLTPKVEVRKPNRSNVNLSFITRFSAAPGVLYPCCIWDAYPGDHFHIDYEAMIKTHPLNSILMGSFKVQFDTFFCPIRYYHRFLHDDRVDFDPSNILFPIMYVRQYVDPVPSGLRSGVDPSSLYHFLGIPERFAYISDSGEDTDRRFNAIPLLAYHDIFRSYYANSQESRYRYIGSGTSVDLNGRWLDAPLSLIDDMRQNILQANPSTPFVVIDADDVYGGSYSSVISHCPLGGLISRTYLPDRFSVWVDTDRYDLTLSKSTVNTGSGSFDMDAFKLANKYQKMLLKTLVSGGRYSDWSYSQYGTSMRMAIEAPIFVGTYSTEVVFEDVVQTSDAGANDDPLGTLGARGRSYMRNKKLSYFVRENGFVMTIMSIIPRVDYFQGVSHYLNRFSLSSLHVPTLDNIGFQDLLVDEFYSASTGIDPATGFPNSYTSVGKQPAWTELMTRVNELHGDFAADQETSAVGLSTLVLQRSFTNSNDTVNTVDFTSYIDPGKFNYAFADSSLTAQNFWVQLKADCVVKRAISKAALPHL